MDGLKQVVNSKSEIIEQIQHDLNGLKDSCQFISDKADKITLDANEDKLEKKAIMEEQKAAVDNLKLRANDSEDYSRRSNLLFYNIPEISGYENCEQKVQSYLHQLLPESRDELYFDRVHRLGAPKEGKIRPIIARFTYPKQKDFVLRETRAITGKRFGIGEDFSKATGLIRKELMGYLKAIKLDTESKVVKGHLSYKTLVLHVQISNDKIIYRRRTLADIKTYPHSWFKQDMTQL